MLTSTEDQIATVLALRPKARTPDAAAPEAPAPRRTERAPSNVVELSRRRRRTKREHYEPQGGDAA
jgi:hypothetical protein